MRVLGPALIFLSSAGPSPFIFQDNLICLICLIAVTGYVDVDSPKGLDASTALTTILISIDGNTRLSQEE